MSALVRSFRILRSSQVAVLTVAFVACATAQDPEVEDQGPGTGNTTTTGGGGGGGIANAGGKGGSLPLAGTTSFPTAGTTSTGTGGRTGTGGTGTATGGVAPTAGTGSMSTAGTGSSSSCPAYAGTLAKDSTIFTGGYGKSKTGTWSGYGFTFKYGTATITPGMGQDCFQAAKFCASGSVPASDSAGAGLGWNISQAQGTSTTMKAAVTTPVKITLAGATAGMRVQLSASATEQYCYTLTASDVGATGATIPAASFKKDCWDTATAVAYAGTPVEAIQVVVPGAAAGAKTFDFCVVDVEPG